MNYQTEVPALISRLKITKKAAAEVMGFSQQAFHYKVKLQRNNKFTEDNYNRLIDWAKNMRV